MTDRLLQLGEVADHVGLSAYGRYHEEMGRLAPADRTEGGFRLFSEDQVARLLLIKRMKPLRSAVQESRALLDTHDVLADDDARVDALREQLSRAELRRETERARPAPSRG